MPIKPEPRHATVPKIFRGIPTIPKYPAPGPVKQLMKDINYIKALDTIPCAPASWQVIVETGLETAGPALLTLFLPGCNDIVKTKLGLSPWHARGIKGMISKAVQPEAVNATKFLYKIGYFTAEKYLWFFQVAEVTKNFFITWQSAVYMAQQCQLPSAGTAHGYIAPFIYPGDASGPLAIAPLKLVPGVSCGLSNVAIAPGFQGSFSFTCEWQTWPERGGAANVSTWYTEDGSETVYDASTTYNPATGQKNTTAAAFWAKNDSHSAQRNFRLWMAADSATHVQPVSGTWTMSSQGRHSGLASFGCLP
ncbi:MAG TPA: hypothetical protein VM715_13255, partial [Candidatus Acidoferrum sp.]|nr:hypothetical protein [Candidatus Acidoferrum sp.]